MSFDREPVQAALDSLLYRSTLRNGRKPHLIFEGPLAPTGFHYYLQFAADRPGHLIVDLPAAGTGGNAEVWMWAVQTARTLKDAPGFKVVEDILGEGEDAMPHLAVTIDLDRHRPAQAVPVLVGIVESFFQRLGVDILDVRTEEEEIES